MRCVDVVIYESGMRALHTLLVAKSARKMCALLAEVYFGALEASNFNFELKL